MSIRTRSVPGEYYHVFNRGVEKRVVFSNNHDYQRFLILMFLVNNTGGVDIKNEFKNYTLNEILKKERTPLVTIHAYSLLPNHYHLLLSALSESGVAKFMQKLGTGYTMYFNAKNSRTGGLFQGKYKIKHATDNNYIKYLFEYIHLNPIRESFNASSGQVTEELLRQAEEYPWSSLAVYNDRVKGALGSSILNQELFASLFGSHEEHRSLLKEWRANEEPSDGGSTSVTGFFPG